jgi:formate hydrogenlyase subunit 6/NADH:ubiquinone oxidoreductase subunit I
VNVDTCIGCQLCAKFCPPDYDAVHMFPFDEGIRLAEAEERNFNYRIYDKKDGGAIPA